MESRLVDTTPTTRNDALARCLIAIELSKASWVVGMQTPLSSKTSQYRLTAGDWKSLLLALAPRMRDLGNGIKFRPDISWCSAKLHACNGLQPWITSARLPHQPRGGAMMP